MEITRDEWLKRAANRYIERVELDEKTARDLAESCLENVDGDLSEKPEDVVDDDLACWSDD